jgi:hypothetical protein
VHEFRRFTGYVLVHVHASSVFGLAALRASMHAVDVVNKGTRDLADQTDVLMCRGKITLG